MPTKKPQVEAHVLDPALPAPPDPFKPTRDNSTLEMQRVQSGGLSDDPTDSGAPVINTTPFKGLHGGR